MEISRRRFVAGTCAGAALLTMGRGAFASSRTAGKRLTLLHVTDTHAQLETHWEYLPGASGHGGLSAFVQGLISIS